MEKIIKSAGKLTKFPELGRIVPEVNRADIRELIFQNYRIIYKCKPETILILIIMHGSRLLKETGPWLIE